MIFLFNWMISRSTRGVGSFAQNIRANIKQLVCNHHLLRDWSTVQRGRLYRDHLFINPKKHLKANCTYHKTTHSVMYSTFSANYLPVGAQPPPHLVATLCLDHLGSAKGKMDIQAAHES